MAAARFVPGFRCYSTGNREQITGRGTQTGRPGGRAARRQLAVCQRGPAIRGPLRPARPLRGRAGDFIAVQLGGIGHLELLSPPVDLSLGHRVRLVRRGCLAMRDPRKLGVPVHRQVNHPARRVGRPRQPAQRRPFIPAQNPKSSTTLVPSRSICRATQMSRPSSTSRLPSASGLPNSGIIHSSGVSRSAWCAAASSFACVVFPALGSPTIRNNVATRRYCPTERPGHTSFSLTVGAFSDG
jgi:hypothetical protein